MNTQFSCVFSNTLGFVRQRKREFARYMSVGMTRGEMKKCSALRRLPIILAGAMYAKSIWLRF